MSRLVILLLKLEQKTEQPFQRTLFFQLKKRALVYSFIQKQRQNWRARMCVCMCSSKNETSKSNSNSGNNRRKKKQSASRTEMCVVREREYEKEPCTCLSHMHTAFHWIRQQQRQNAHWEKQHTENHKYQLCISTFVACTFSFRSVSFVCLVSTIMETNDTRKTMSWDWNCLRSYSFSLFLSFGLSLSLFVC